MKRTLFVVAAILGTACFGSETDLETAFCDGLEQTAARTVTAAATPEDAPDVTDASRVDIQVSTASSETGGFISYLPDESGTFAFGFTEDVPLTIRDAEGMPVELDETVTGSMLCDALAVRHSVTLTIQRYTIELGALSAGTVGIIAEESDDDL